MEQFQREFINLLKAGFSGKAEKISPDFDFEKATQLAKAHNIAPILYYGATNCKIPQEEQFMQALYQLTLKSIMVSMRQTHELERLQKAFEAENIEYMLLKGTILKAIYPKPEMRTMGDADVLIKLEQYPKIASVMEALQYTFKGETDHEMVWTKPSLYLELHKSIMTTYNKDFYGYFGTGWKLAKKLPGSSGYQMSTEDFYLFMFVHFTKHYRISGIGIKHLLDMWVYANAHPELDWSYVEAELKKLQLAQFHGNIQKTIAVWFGEEASTDVTDLITNVIFSSGQYGSAEMAIINRSLQKGKKAVWRIKASQFFDGVFLPYKAMKVKYPVLNKAPILLPVMWVVRVFGILLRPKGRVRMFVDRMEQIDDDKLRRNEKVLKFVGLDFHADE